MKPYEVMIQNQLENIQIKPQAELRSRVLEDAATGADAPRFAGRKIGVRAAILAAVFAALSLTTAFAYGDEIIGALRQFMFGDSSAAQFEVIDEDIIIRFTIINRSGLVEPGVINGYIGFSTMEEARQAAPFTVREPLYLPENAVLDMVNVARCKDGSYGYDVQIGYTIELPDGNGRLDLFQYYAGPDAYIELDTTYSIQKTAVGGIEASVLQGEGDTYLYWIKDDVLYELFSRAYDLETLRAIAESV